MTEQPKTLLAQLGFRFGRNGPHAARTMMLNELQSLFASLPPNARRDDYAAAIVDYNLLSKPTKKSRELTYRHLTALYSLDTANPLFRALRALWNADEPAQPMLAFAAAMGRDPLLKLTQPFYLAMVPGTIVRRESVEGFLSETLPDRFSPASLKSIAQNVSGSWTAAGYLSGRHQKVRTHPKVYPASLTLLLFLGYLEGLSGQRLFSSNWMTLTETPTDMLEQLATAASQRGLLVFMNAGGVKEVRFPGYLTISEESIREQVSHVI